MVGGFLRTSTNGLKFGFGLNLEFSGLTELFNLRES